MAGCGPRDIFEALINAGATTVQAIGIMANMINESSLNVETGLGGGAIDNNGYPVYGLVSWNAKYYPNAHSLVTGNCADDLKAQVNYLAMTGAFTAAGGGTPAEAAGNFAANYENCVGCEPGGPQYQARAGNAATVAAWASSGKFPVKYGSSATTPGGPVSPGVTQATLTAAGGNAAATSNCLWGIGGQHLGFFFGHGPSLPTYCIFTKSEARALVGASMIIAGGMLALPGLFMVAIFSFKRAGGQEAANQAAGVLEPVPVYGQAIRYARTRSENRAAQRQGYRAEQLRQRRAAGRKQARTP